MSDLDPDMKEASVESEANPFQDLYSAYGQAPSGKGLVENPFAHLYEAPPSAGGAFVRSAARNAIPGVAGFAGAGAGAEAGGLLGAAVAGPPGALVGGVLGGLGGAVLGTGAVAKAQDYALKALPDSWQEALGQSDRQQRLDEEAHPYASFLGGIAPFALTMNPFGTAFKTLPAGATAMDKIMAYQPAERLFGGAVMGGMELGQEAIGGEPIDWRKVAISTGSGIVFNTTNRFGHYLTEVGGKPARSLAEAAGLRVVGPGITESVASGAEKPNPEADQANQDLHRQEEMLGVPGDKERLDEWLQARQPAPAADIHAIARRLDPETFEKYDPLVEQKEEFRRQIRDIQNPSEEMYAPLHDARAEIAAQIAEIPPQAKKRTPEMQRHLSGLMADMESIDREISELNERRTAYASGKREETQETADLRRRIAETDVAMRDLVPAVSAAYSRAREHPTLQPGWKPPEAGTEAAEGKEASPPAKQPMSIAEQHAFIANDLKRRLVEAGRPEDEAEHLGQYLANGYVNRPHSLYGSDGPLGLYLEEGADIRPWTPPGGKKATEPPPVGATAAATPPTGAETAEASSVAEPAVAGSKVGDRFVINNTRYTVTAIDDAKVALKQEGRGKDKAKEIITVTRSFFDKANAAQAEAAAASAETAAKPGEEAISIGGDKVDPKLAAVLRAAMERQEQTKPAAGNEWTAFEAQRKEVRTGPEIGSGRNPGWDNAAFRPAHGKRRQEWEPGNIVDVGFTKDLLIVGKNEDGSWRLIGKPDANGESKLYSQISHGGLQREGGTVDFAKETEHLRTPSEEATAPPTAIDRGAREAAVSAKLSSFTDELDALKKQMWEDADREHGPSEEAPPLIPTPDKPVVVPEPAAAATPQENLANGLEAINARDIHVDAKRMQFKAGGDEEGVTERLKGVDEWNPMLAGTVIVWRDAAGKNWVADGHQRTGLARRLMDSGHDPIKVNAFVLKESEGFADADARVQAAAKNIAEGTGTAIDAAKIFKEAEGLNIKLPPLPPRSTLVKDGRALANLSPDAFGMIVNEVVPPNMGAIVGRLVKDPLQQVEALRIISKAKIENARQAEIVVKDMLAQGTEMATETGSLFGEEAFASSVVLERAKILDDAIKLLRQDKKTFKTLVEDSDRISGHGANKLDAEANKSRLTEDERVQEYVEKLATRAGPISDALTDVAKRFKAGDTSRAEAARSFLGHVRGKSPEVVAAGDHVGSAEPGAAGGGQDSFFQRRQQEPAGKTTGIGTTKPVVWLKTGWQGVNADFSTPIHEHGHVFLESMGRDVRREGAPEQLKTDWETVKNWLGVKGDARIAKSQHEKFAEGLETYIYEGHAPTKALAGVFERFKQWMRQIYEDVTSIGFNKGNKLTPEMRAVFDRMFAPLDREPVTAAKRDRRPSIADEHEIDARLTAAHHAEPHADRVAAEARRGEADIPPRMDDELRAEEEATRAAGAETSGEAGGSAGAEGKVGEAGGKSESVASGGPRSEPNAPIVEGGGKSVSEGAGLPDWTGAGRTGADERSDAGRGSKSPLEPVQRDRFGPTESKVTDLAGNIRLENLTDEESIRQSLRESAERNNEFKDQRGSATKAQIYDAAEAMGYEPGSREAHKFAEDLLSRTGNLARDVLAARMLVVKSAERINALAKRLAESKSDEDAYALALAVTQHDMVQSTVAGVTASWGRTGNAFHSLLHGWGDAQKINQVLKENTGRTLFQMKQLGLLLSELDTPESVSKVIRDAGKRSWGRMVLEYWINGLISGPTTHMTYGIGNTLLAMTKLGPETAAAAVIGALRKDASRERVRFGEIGEQIKGAAAVAPGAAKAAATSATTGMNVRLPGEKPRAAPYQVEGVVQPMHVLEPGYEYTKVMPDLLGAVRGARDAAVAAGALIKAGKGGFEKQLSASGQIPNLSYNGVTVAPVGTLARLPSHGVAAIHSFFKSFNYSMEIYAQAYRKAAAEAEEKGLAGADYKNHVAMRTAQLRQDPTPQMMQAAHKEAYDLTLMGQGGEVTKLLSRLTNIPFFEGTHAEVPLLKFIDPFVHISSNIISETLGKRTPLGWLSPEIRKDLTGGNGAIAQDKAQARMLLGTLYGLAFASLASEGYATGSGPKDPDEAMLWRMAGNQAHSVRIGNMWYDTHRLGPLGMLFSLSADAYQVAQHAGEGDLTGVMTSLHHAFIQNILDESFMRGPAEAIRAIEQPERYGRQWVDNFASSFVPYSVAMSQMERAVDPYSRNARNIIDTVKSKLPFESLYGTVMPRRDIWGEELPNKEALGMKGLTAIYVQKMNDDPVNHAMLDLGVHKGQVERRIRGIELTDQQFDDYARIAGRMTKQRLDVIVNSPDFQRMPNWVRKSVIEKVIEQNRETALGMMLMKYPEIPAQALNNKRALYGQ